MFNDPFFLIGGLVAIVAICAILKTGEKPSSVRSKVPVRRK